MAGRDTHRVLSAAELGELASEKGMEVGAHTVTHPRLSQLPAHKQREEIFEGKASLETITSRELTSFAYPFGKDCDYTEVTARLVREAGFRRACVNSRGRVLPATDRFAIPRMVIHDYPGDEFARRLARWALA